MNCLESDTIRKQRSVAFWRMRRMSARIVRVSWAEVSPDLLELLGGCAAQVEHTQLS